MNFQEIKTIKDDTKRLAACRSFVGMGRGSFGELGWARGEVRAILKKQREAAPKYKHDATRAVLAVVLEPQRAGFVEFWVAQEATHIARVKEQAAAADHDLDALVKDPYERGISHEETTRRKNGRAYYTAVLVRDGERCEAAKEEYRQANRATDFKNYDPNFRRCFLKADTAHEEKMLKDAAEAAGGHFDSFISKMTDKLGDGVTTADLEGRVWTNCTLTAFKGDVKEVWHTQMILNRSVLGTLFNQWPSRKAK